MKGERRHELEQNQLADWLAQKIEAVKPYTNWILGTLLLLAVGGTWYSISSRQATALEGEGWDQLYAALAAGEHSPGELEEIVAEYDGTPLAHWAATLAGDLRLDLGCKYLFFNKPTANQELRDAEGHYRTVFEQSSSSMLRERATYGLARTLEAQGNLEKAIERYDEVGTKWPNGAYAKAAATRSKDLQKESTKTFYDRFSKFDPQPPAAGDSGGAAARLPFDIDSLPDDPNFKSGMFDSIGGGTEDEEPVSPATSDEPDTTVPDPTVPDTTVPDTTVPDATVPDADAADDAEATDMDADAGEDDATADASDSPPVGPKIPDAADSEQSPAGTE